MGKTIGVLSIKGGVGKTSVVVALGDAISDFGKKVLMIDANFSAPNLGTHLKIIDPEKTLHDVLGRTARLKDAIQKSEHTKKSKIFQRGKTESLHGFDVLPSKIFNKQKISPLELKNKIKSLKNKYDIILIDSSPALNEESLAAMLASDELIIVATPDIPTLTSTLKIVKLVKQRKVPINGLILNKTHSKSFELSVHDIEETTGIPVLAVIPYDLNVLKAVSKFIPSTSYKPNSESSLEYKKLAGILIGIKYKPKRLRNFFKLTPKKHEINREIFYERVFK